mmetsp:Transcript_19243/g.27065  ORF Transcript_19243/g.27065 Transcript_19243/m.27065 type:complete len:307 (+) Transcript_19243:42-962(+)
MHVFDDLNKTTDENRDDNIIKCMEFVKHHLANEKCKQPSGYMKYVSSCTCLSFLLGEDSDLVLKHIAMYMLHWKDQPLAAKRICINQSYQYSLSKAPAKTKKGTELKKPRLVKSFMIPVQLDSTIDLKTAVDFSSHLICRYAYCNLLNIGRKLWMSAVKEPMKEHKNKNNKHASISKDTESKMHTFFASLKDQCSPFDAGIVRDKSCVRLRDDDPDALSLPPHYSKRKVYEKWCWSVGWKVKKKSASQGIYASPSDYSPRPHDDDVECPLWPTGSISTVPVSWSTFRRFWVNHYSHIIIRKRGSDV